MYNSKIEKYQPIKQGPQGQPGNPGPPGAQGIQGLRGYNGKDGLQGDTGPTGPTGKTGEGYTGPTGSMGPQGLQGENSGFTGPTGEHGAQGLIGPTGPAGDNLIIYNDMSIYTLKLMPEFNRITINTPLYITNDQNVEHINKGILHLQYSGPNKYVTAITASKEGFNINFILFTNAPIKYLNLTSMGGNLSIPISYTNITYLSSQQVQITFSFDSILAFDEYVFVGALYHLHINWF